MKRKIVAILIFVSLLVVLITISVLNFTGNEPHGDNLDDVFNSTTLSQSGNTTIQNSMQEKTTENTLTSQGQESILEMTPQEMVAATTQAPSLAISWDVEDVIEYKGGEIVTEVTVTNGSFKIEKGFSISLNGILQECVIEYEGIKTKPSIMPIVVLEANRELTFKISFTPNIGKKGEEFEMSLLHSYLPNYKIDDNMQLKVFLRGQHSILTVGNLKLRLNVDSLQSTNVTNNFSGTKTSKLNDVLYTSHYYENVEGDIFNDAYEANRVVLYHDFNKVYTVSEGVFYDYVEYLCSMTLPRTEKTPLTINLYGKPGKRRVCLLINNELQPVFDGNYYTDVEFKEGEQVELLVEIDISDLDKYNCIYALSKELNEVKDPEEHLLKQSDPYVLIVE